MYAYRITIIDLKGLEVVEVAHEFVDAGNEPERRRMVRDRVILGKDYITLETLEQYHLYFERLCKLPDRYGELDDAEEG